MNATRSQTVTVIALCFLTILLDGYDTSVLSYVAPTLAHDWAVGPAAFTPAFVATSLGAVIGYIFCGPLAARFGHKRLMAVSVGFFGVMSLASLLATNVTEMTGLRFVTALGLGGAIPTAIALASEYASGRRRELVAALVTVAIVIGGTLGGIVAGPLLRGWGWQGPFVLGAVLPVLLAVALAAGLPDTRLARKSGTSPRQLFAGGLGWPTALLWAMAFLSFMQTYSFTYFLPLLMTSFGVDRAGAALGSTYIGSGGIAGVALMLVCVQWTGSPRYLAMAFTVGACFVLMLAFGGLGNAAVPWLLFLIGAGLTIGGTGQAAIGALLYPAELRTTGIGWSSAMGRVGSIVGPGITGAFLALHWPATDVIALAAIPAFAAAIAAFAIHRLARRRALLGAAHA